METTSRKSVGGLREPEVHGIERGVATWLGRQESARAIERKAATLPGFDISQHFTASPDDF